MLFNPLSHQKKRGWETSKRLHHTQYLRGKKIKFEKELAALQGFHVGALDVIICQKKAEGA